MRHPSFISGWTRCGVHIHDRFGMVIGVLSEASAAHQHRIPAVQLKAAKKGAQVIKRMLRGWGILDDFCEFYDPRRDAA